MNKEQFLFFWDIADGTLRSVKRMNAKAPVNRHSVLSESCDRLSLLYVQRRHIP